ncbi:F-box protein SKP2A [Linum grandiflorum]
MVRSEELNRCFDKLMMVCSDEKGQKIGGGGVAAMAEWKDIPMELLLRILAVVDDHRTIIVASEVCSGWREAVFLGLDHLCLSWCKNNMNSLVLSLAPKLRNLQRLELRQGKPQLEDNAVETIASHCHDLQDLDLSKSFKLTDRSLYALAHGCRNLVKLNISGCTSFSDDGLEYLTGFCRKLKILNLCGCLRAATDHALQAIGRNCSGLQLLNLGWCENVGDNGVMSLAYGCPKLRTLDLCGCVLITDDSVIALANRCPHLTSLGLYFCQNITDKALYSLVHSRVNNKPALWETMKSRKDEEGLKSLNISQCTALTPPAVQALCDSFPDLHTCSGRHSLVMSGCLNLTSVHCACAVQAHHRSLSYVPQHHAH